MMPTARPGSQPEKTWEARPARVNRIATAIRGALLRLQSMILGSGGVEDVYLYDAPRAGAFQGFVGAPAASPRAHCAVRSRYQPDGRGR